MSRPFRTLKNFLIYAVIRAAVAFGALLPERWTRAVCVALAALGHRLAGHERRRALRAAQRVYGEDRGREVVRGAFLSLGRSVAELVHRESLVRRLDRQGITGPVRLSATDRAVLDAALAEGKGVLYVTAHLGNWELMASTLAWLGYPISTVARASYDERLTAWIDRWRRGGGVHAILRRSSHKPEPRVARESLRTLRAGRVLGVLMDVDLPAAEGVPARFLGLPVTVPIGPARMALRTGARVVAGFMERQADGTHRLRLEAIATGDDPTELALRMSAAIEVAVRRTPEQWAWIHRKWRELESGEESRLVESRSAPAHT